MLLTPNLNLKKPEGADNVNIEDLNENADTLDTAITSKAPLESPELTGVPKATTAAAGSNTTQIANAAYVRGEVGDRAGLMTTAKNTIVAAMNELFTLASNGKSAIAAAITGKGVPATGNDTFSQLATKIGSILLATGNAVASDVLSSKTFSNGSVNGTAGTMPNQGAVTITPSASSQTIPAGYHNGSGSIPAVSVPASNVKTGTTIAGTAGTMPDRGAVTITPSAANQTIAAGYHNGAGVVAAVLVPAGSVLVGTTIAGTAGTMPNNGGGTIKPNTANQAVAAGYTSGVTILGSANLTADNIAEGVNIFDVVGTAAPLRYVSGSGLKAASSVGSISYSIPTQSLGNDCCTAKRLTEPEGRFLQYYYYE